MMIGKAHVLSAGFTLLALNFFASGQDLMGAFFFVLSLGFKQMALYYAPAIGTYLLAKCLYLGPIDGYLFIFARLILLLLNVCCQRLAIYSFGARYYFDIPSSFPTLPSTISTLLCRP